MRLVATMLDAGADPSEVLEEAKAAMTVLGDKFECEEVFIPELIMGGEIMKGIAEELKPRIKGEAAVAEPRHHRLGTVAGDIHDIGKDVVVLMLEVNGYDVHDLGIDVPVEKFVAAINELEPQVVGLSGLLTLAFDSMKATIDGIAAAGLRDQVKIMIGGSPVDEQVCAYTGADGWGRDAAAALRLAAEWTGRCGMTAARPRSSTRSASSASTTSSRSRSPTACPSCRSTSTTSRRSSRASPTRTPATTTRRAGSRQGGDAPVRLELRADQRRARLRLLRRLRQQADHAGPGRRAASPTTPRSSGSRTSTSRPTSSTEFLADPNGFTLQQDPSAHGLQAGGPRPDPAPAAVLVLQQLLPAGARQHARHPAAQAALQAMLDMAEAQEKTNAANGKYLQEMEDLGYPPTWAPALMPAFDVRLRHFRSLRGSTLDMFRQPDKLLPGHRRDAGRRPSACCTRRFASHRHPAASSSPCTGRRRLHERRAVREVLLADLQGAHRGVRRGRHHADAALRGRLHAAPQVPGGAAARQGRGALRQHRPQEVQGGLRRHDVLLGQRAELAARAPARPAGQGRRQGARSTCSARPGSSSTARAASPTRRSPRTSRRSPRPSRSTAAL